MGASGENVPGIRGVFGRQQGDIRVVPGGIRRTLGGAMHRGGVTGHKGGRCQEAVGRRLRCITMGVSGASRKHQASVRGASGRGGTWASDVHQVCI